MTKNTKFLLVGLAVALLLAGFVSGYASSSPDGLNKVAIDQEFRNGGDGDEHGFAGSPLADYAVSGIDNERLAGGLAGVIGVGITFVIGGALFFAVARLRRGRGQDSSHQTHAGSSTA